jgi:hypothetical protein
MSDEPILLLGCGILSKEVEYLNARNGWGLETAFLDSALHNYFNRLAKGLSGSLSKRAGRDIIVFYGCCHPLMDRMLDEARTFRTEGQNCVEMLLGRERFMAELEAGAFFLLEEWAERWEELFADLFGPNPDVAREIFGGDRGYILAVRTPCSGDFSRHAEAMAARVGLPLRWTEVDLGHQEAILRQAIDRKLGKTNG